jgi:hypothetical protein
VFCGRAKVALGGGKGGSGEKLYLAGSKDGGWVYTEPFWRTQNGNPRIILVNGYLRYSVQTFGLRKLFQCEFKFK